MIKRNKRSMGLAVALALGGTGLFALPVSANENVVTILIRDVETPDTRAAQGKFLDVKKASVPSEQSALTPEDRATLDPEFLGAIREQEVLERIEATKSRREEVEADNRRRQRVADSLREEFVGTERGRNIIQAREWLTAGLGAYSDFVQVVDRSEQSVAQDEIARNGGQQSLAGGIDYYMRIIVGDVSERKTSVQAYGVETERVTKKMSVSVAINDLNDRQVFSRSFDGEMVRTYSSYGNTTGGDDHEELLRSALSQAADAIGEHFTANLTVTLVPPREQADMFDPGMVTILVNGNYLPEGVETRLAKGTYTVEVESQDYQDVSRTINLRSDMPLRIPLQSAFAYVELALNGQPDVDIYLLAVDFTDETGALETLYGPGPHRLAKGSYQVRSEVEGYQAFEIPRYRLTRGTEDAPTTLAVSLRPAVQNVE